MDSYTKLAKQTVEAYIKDGKTIKPPEDLPKEMLLKKAGVFVSLKKTRSARLASRQAVAGARREGGLRGCIGTFVPTQENLALEIIQNAISAATKDLRFHPVTKNELKDLCYSVDILSKPEPVTDVKQLDPKKYGIIVANQFGYRGLLLPGLDGVDKVETQLKIACDKAGIDYQKEPLQIERFTVERHK